MGEVLTMASGNRNSKDRENWMNMKGLVFVAYALKIYLETFFSEILLKKINRILIILLMGLKKKLSVGIA